MTSVILERRYAPYLSPMLHSPTRVLLLAATTLLLEGCGKKPDATKTAAPPTRLVTTAKVIARDSPLYVDEIGTCAAQESVSIQAQVTGQITQRHFADGADVKKGDPLFTIDPRPYQAALDQAQGALDTNKAKLKLDQINLQRALDLQSKKVIAPQDLDTAKTTVTTDEAQIESAQAALAAAQVNLDYCSIKSPLDGRAGLRLVDVGNVVSANAGSSVLLTIQKLDPIYTDFTIAENDLAQVRKYQPKGNLKVETDLPDDKAPPRLGDLYFLDTTVQAGAGTIKARGVTPNSDHLLLPGAFVHVRLILDTLKDARLIPNQALQISQRGPFVFVVKPDSTLDQRTVTPGQRQGDLVVVSQGVQPGEAVVTSGQLALAPGMKVNAQPDPAYNKDTPAPEAKQ